MKTIALKPPQERSATKLAPLTEDELNQVAGGFDDNNWCGTVPRRWPFPRPLLGDGLIIREQVGPTLGRAGLGLVGIG